MCTDDTTLIEVVEPSSFAAAGDRLPVHPSSSRSTGQPQQVPMFFCGARTVERDTAYQEKEAEQLEFEARPDFRNFRTWRMNLRTTRLSAKSVADLKIAFSVTGTELQTNFEVLDPAIASGLKQTINGDVKRRVFIQEEAAQQEKRFLTGRQVEWMMYEYVKVRDTDESVLHFNEK